MAPVHDRRWGGNLVIERRLDTLEVQVLGEAPAHVLEFSGTLDIGTFERALRELCARHPVLHARVHLDGQRFSFRSSPDYVARVAVLNGNTKTVRQVISQTWDPFEALTSVTVVRRSHNDLLIFRSDHAIADGSAKIALLNELSQLYASALDASDLCGPRPTVLPIAPTKLLTSRTSLAPSARTLEKISLRKITEGMPPSNPAHQEVFTFNKTETTKIIRLAKVHGVSVHALICAAIIATHRKHSPIAGNADIACVSAVNLRQRVRPHVEPTETTNLIGAHIAEVSVPKKPSVVAIACELRRQLEVAVRSQIVLMPWDWDKILSTPANSPIEQHLARVSISNYGHIPKMTHGPAATVLDIKRLTNTTPATFPFVAIQTYVDELTLQAVYPSTFFESDQVRRICKEVKGTLLAN